jgi:hypothetical protein
LAALEPLCRNVAIRRHNPANRWILSTNTDMVFVVRPSGLSLSDVVSGVPDGFYELPRFEVPEMLWETLDRSDPSATIATLKRWGSRLRLNEVALMAPDIRFDAPGDFQLMLHDQVYAISGFNEEMTLGWHVDGNIAKRLCILNGETRSLLDSVFAYHCDHTREVTRGHSSKRTQNNINRFYFQIVSPYLPVQRDRWGLPDEDIEEFGLASRGVLPSVALEEILPESNPEFASEPSADSRGFDHGLIYDTFHVLPYLANSLANARPDSIIGYFGTNADLVRLIREYLERRRHTGRVMARLSGTVVSAGGVHAESSDPEIAWRDLVRQSDILILDAGMMNLPHVRGSSGAVFPAADWACLEFEREFRTAIRQCVTDERLRLRTSGARPRKFVFVSTVNTRFDSLVTTYFDTAVTPWSTHIREGYVGPASWQRSWKLHMRDTVLPFALRRGRALKRVPLVSGVASSVFDWLARHVSKS